jgi:hypothetical protein
MAPLLGKVGCPPPGSSPLNPWASVSEKVAALRAAISRDGE